MNLPVASGDYLSVNRDALLVVRAQLGDRRALAELVERWHEPVWRFVRGMLGAPGAADDVSQEVWASALRSLPGLRQPERFTPWLFTIARRGVMDHLRGRYEPAEALPERPEPAVPDGVDDVLDRAQVAAGLAGIPVQEREVLILFYLHDLSLEDCAQILDVPVGTVKSRLHRARRLVRDHLIERGFSE